MAKIGFLMRVANVSLRTLSRAAAPVFRKSVEVIRASGNDAHKGGVPGTSSGELILGRPRTSWRDYVSTLAWEHLAIPPSELTNVAWEREVRAPR